MRELLTALGLGIAAGLTPGPLHSLIAATALKRGTKPALRLAFAPLISDLPAVLLSLWVAATMSDTVARVLAVIGGLFLIGLSVQGLRATEDSVDPAEESDRPWRDFVKGGVVNILNPNPWIFWLGVGAPLLRGVWDQGPSYGVLWLGVFYLGIVGVKVAFAVGLGKTRERLPDRWLRVSIVGSTLLMLVVGIWLVYRGVSGNI
jgi:threonine/homoserine/homoserine lactone efflux protein